MEKKLFGTDGVRARANTYPMTPETAGKIGQAVAHFFSAQDKKTQIVIGKDTRISGDMIEAAVASGICSAGGDAILTGVLPTPGIALAAQNLNADAGIVISASHNPYYDNGIKVFAGNGHKLTDQQEADIEKLVFSPPPSADNVGRIIHQTDASNVYVDFLLNTVPANLPVSGMGVVLDCGNGATFSVAPQVFSRLGADVTALFVSPDGININADCGSQHTDTLQETVIRKKARIGLAFDGDGDRLIAVDENGRVVTGDQILAICARHLKNCGRLANNTVVSTVMSNLGFKKAMDALDIKHVVTDVGDRYVLEGMRQSGAIIGGEDSGHMIFFEHHTTGDGILSALQLLDAMTTQKKPLSELAAIMDVFPQVLINVEVDSKPELASIAKINDAIESAEKALNNDGRILVRYSGTRPVCRVMVEGPTKEITTRCAQDIARAVRQTIGLAS